MTVPVKYTSAEPQFRRKLNDVEVWREIDEVSGHHALALHVDDVAKGAAQVFLYQTFGSLFCYLKFMFLG
jgi:hypothetical protein